MIDAAVAAGAKGIVIAGVGNGNMTKTALDALAAQAKKGIVCVRSIARGHRPRRPQRRGGRRQAGARRLGRPQSPEGAGAAPPRAAEAAQPGRDPAAVRGVLTVGRKAKEGVRNVMKMRTLAVAAALSLVGATAFAQDVKMDFDKDAELRRHQDLLRQARHELGQPARREAGPGRDRAGARRRRAGRKTDAEQGRRDRGAPRRDREAEDR